MFVILRDEYPRLEHEFQPLIASLAIFSAMTAISALSFYWMLTRHRYRFAGQGVMWLAVLLTGYLLWP